MTSERKLMKKVIKELKIQRLKALEKTRAEAARTRTRRTSERKKRKKLREREAEAEELKVVELVEENLLVASAAPLPTEASDAIVAIAILESTETTCQVAEIICKYISLLRFYMIMKS